jgi:hypothetical protein
MREIGWAQLHENVAAEGLSDNICCGCTDLFAGKPAPTVIKGCPNSMFASEPCGSGLAREGPVATTQIPTRRVIFPGAETQNANPRVGVLFSSSEA